MHGCEKRKSLPEALILWFLCLSSKLAYSVKMVFNIAIVFVISGTVRAAGISC